MGDALVEVLEGVSEGHVGAAVCAPCQQGETEPHGGAVAMVEYGTIGAQHACFTGACDRCGGAQMLHYLYGEVLAIQSSINGVGNKYCLFSSTEHVGTQSEVLVELHLFYHRQTAEGYFK